MGRLIDADDFKKFLQALCKAGAPYSEVIQLLDRQETAYDVEKVVEEIKKENKDEVNAGMCESGFIHCLTAIDIVREGGV